MTHRQWVTNEYDEWVKALNECTVDNYNDHPMVRRMLGDPVEREERYKHYAAIIAEMKPQHIYEIGGGIGEFYYHLRAAGYQGTYFICDLIDVWMFQLQWLAMRQLSSGLDLTQKHSDTDYLLVSFYALGEFEDGVKETYQSLIDHAASGYIVWNPHSGATDDLSLFNAHTIKVTPGTEPGIKIITW